MEERRVRKSNGRYIGFPERARWEEGKWAAWFGLGRGESKGTVRREREGGGPGGLGRKGKRNFFSSLWYFLVLNFGRNM